jgi:hypothetical protein
MDEHGYPDENDLKEIRMLSGNFKEKDSKLEPWNLIDKIKDLWIYEDYIELKKTDREWSLQISTGGWSGHETVISELQGSLFWWCYWQVSKRGGHFWFHGKLGEAAQERSDSNE